MQLARRRNGMSSFVFSFGQSSGKFSTRLVACLLGICSALSASAGLTLVKSDVPERVVKRFGSKDALVIGIDQYEHGPYKNSVNDAMAINEKLEAAGYKTLFQQNSERGPLLAAVNAFAAKVKGEDFESLHIDQDAPKSVLLYFSGLCIVKDDTYWLAPSDFKVSNKSVDTNQFVNLSELLTTIAKSDAKAKIVLVDACFVSLDKSKEASLTVPISLGNNMVIGLAAGPGEMAREEGAADGHGLFTRQLLNFIFEPGVELVDGLHAVWKALPNQRPVLMISANPGFGPVLSPLGAAEAMAETVELPTDEVVLTRTREEVLELLRKGLELAQATLSESGDIEVNVGQFSEHLPMLEPTDQILSLNESLVDGLPEFVGLLESVISEVSLGALTEFEFVVSRPEFGFLTIRFQIGSESVEPVIEDPSGEVPVVPADTNLK